MQIYIRSIRDIANYSSVYHRRAPMAEGNGLQAFELPQIFQGFSKGSATNKEVPLVETVGENSELINGRPNNSTGQTGYLQNMLA